MAEIPLALLNTVTTCLAALCLGIGAGVATALLHWTPLKHLVYALAAGANAVPVTALLPVFIGLFGLTGFVVPAVAFPTWLLTAIALLKALQSLSRERQQACQLGCMTTLNYVIHVAAWEILSPFVAAIRVAVPVTIALVVALDYFLNVVEGLGFRIYMSSVTYQKQDMWISILVVSIFSWTCIFLLDRLQSSVNRRT